MALTATDIRAFGFGHIYVADVGTAFPTNISAAVDLDDWTELGHVSDAGPRFSFGKGSVDITTWQSFPYPARTIRDKAINSISYDLEQWGRESVTLALGGAWTGTSPNFVFTPDPNGPAEVALIVELVDGAAKWRICAERTINKAPTDFAGVGNKDSAIPIQSVFLKPDDDTSAIGYIIQTNDAPSGS